MYRIGRVLSWFGAIFISGFVVPVMCMSASTKQQGLDRIFFVRPQLKAPDEKEVATWPSGLVVSLHTRTQNIGSMDQLREELARRPDNPWERKDTIRAEVVRFVPNWSLKDKVLRDGQFRLLINSQSELEMSFDRYGKAGKTEIIRERLVVGKFLESPDNPHFLDVSLDGVIENVVVYEIELLDGVEVASIVFVDPVTVVNAWGGVEVEQSRQGRNSVFNIARSSNGGWYISKCGRENRSDRGGASHHCGWHLSKKCG